MLHLGAFSGPRVAVAVLVLHDEALLDEAGELHVGALVVLRLLSETIFIRLQLLVRRQLLLDLQLLLLGLHLVGVNLLLRAAAGRLRLQHVRPDALADYQDVRIACVQLTTDCGRRVKRLC